MKEFTHCPVCNSESFSRLTGYENAMLAKCSNCRFVFSNRVPEENELSEYYSYYPLHSTVSEITRKRYREILEDFEKFRKTNNLIDVGCGDGFFLEEAKKKGWNVHGTEYALHYINICKEKGIHMQGGMLNPSNYEPESFDVIASFEVIEHINYPAVEIKNFNSILRKGGIVYITTPNFNSISRRLFKDKWNVIGYPEHLSYYTPQSIHYLLKSCGFKKVNVKTTGVSIDRAKKAMHQKNKEDGEPEKESLVYKTDQSMRENIESSGTLRMVKNVTNAALTLFQLGDTIKATYKKRE
jgi:2-polyprenyl-3-methyl-5-hydroxy-6-metoxy-1,4-benzoquinol methylase